MLIVATRLGPGEPPQDVRVRDGLIAEITPAGELRAGPGEEVREGGALLPGFVDGHLHLATWADALVRLDVSAARSAVEVAELVRIAPGAASGAFGFRDALWPDRPHKDLLPDWPVSVLSADMHTLWLSPAMLAVLGVEHPTGVFRDEVALLLMARVDALRPVADADAAVQEATRVLASRGVTSVLDFEYADGRTDWLRRVQTADPLVRVSVATWREHLEMAQERTGEHLQGHERLRQGPLKVMMDGSLNTRTAACHDAYPDPEDGHGQLFFDADELAELMNRAWAKGISTATHAIGDRAMSVALDGFERVGCPGRIEHAQQVHPRDLTRLRRPGLVVSVQPQHAMADRDVVDHHWPDRESVAFGYASLRRAGGQLQFGSDAPVSLPEPLAAISDAVTRSDDHRPPWIPDESLPLEVALRAACGGHSRLELGEVADAVHLHDHPLDIGLRDLREVPVLTTILGGVITHRSDDT